MAPKGQKIGKIKICEAKNKQTYLILCSSDDICLGEWYFLNLNLNRECISTKGFVKKYRKMVSEIR